MMGLLDLARGLRHRWNRNVRTGNDSATRPVSAVWGLDRGKPIDRYYIERFLRENADAIRGRVLETGDDRYTRLFGGERVERADVLHYGAGNPRATVVGDLVTGAGIPTGMFDCVILVNTMLVVSEPARAMATCARALRLGGVVLAHFTGISATTVDGYGPPGWSGEGDLWRFTSASARFLTEPIFGAENVHVSAYGNVRSASAFLYGRASEELTETELDTYDPRYQVVVCVRAARPA